MPERRSGALLTISVYTEAMSAMGGAPARLRPHVGAAESLLALLRQRAIAATWASCDPLSSAIVAAALGEGVGHERALLIPAAHISEVPALARSISQQLTRAAAHGRPLTVLASQGDAPCVDWAPAVKQGIVALCSVPAGRPLRDAGRAPPRGVLRSLIASCGLGAPALPPARPIRFGLWEIPAAASFPQSEGSLSRSIGGIRRQLSRAAATGALLHLAIDLPALVTGRRGPLDRLQRLLDDVAAERAQQTLEVVTAAEAAARLMRRRSAPPARSILRAA